MTVMMTILKVAGETNDPPRPPRPPAEDQDPSEYVPKPMSSEDRKMLREAALEWTDALGGITMRTMPWLGGAAANMRHFRSGRGRDRILTPGAVQNILDDLNESGQSIKSSVESQFIELIREDMAKVEGRRHYISINTGPGRNHNTPWFGVYAGGSSFYAVGGAKLSFGAAAYGRGSRVAIQYRPYIYDRYNWDSCKPTSIPMAGAIDWLMDETLVEKATALQNKCGMPYIARNGSSYVVSDDFMGSLVESGDAQNFDTVGTGALKTLIFRRDNPISRPHSTTTASGASAPTGANERDGG